MREGLRSGSSELPGVSMKKVSREKQVTEKGNARINFFRSINGKKSEFVPFDTEKVAVVCITANENEKREQSDGVNFRECDLNCNDCGVNGNSADDNTKRMKQLRSGAVESVLKDQFEKDSVLFKSLGLRSRTVITKLGGTKCRGRIDKNDFGEKIVTSEKGCVVPANRNFVESECTGIPTGKPLENLADEQRVTECWNNVENNGDVKKDWTNAPVVFEGSSGYDPNSIGLNRPEATLTNDMKKTCDNENSDLIDESNCISKIEIKGPLISGKKMNMAMNYILPKRCRVDMHGNSLHGCDCDGEDPSSVNLDEDACIAILQSVGNERHVNPYMDVVTKDVNKCKEDSCVNNPQIEQEVNVEYKRKRGRPSKAEKIVAMRVKSACIEMNRSEKTTKKGLISPSVSNSSINNDVDLSFTEESGCCLGMVHAQVNGVEHKLKFETCGTDYEIHNESDGILTEKRGRSSIAQNSGEICIGSFKVSRAGVENEASLGNERIKSFAKIRSSSVVSDGRRAGSKRIHRNGNNKKDGANLENNYSIVDSQNLSAPKSINSGEPPNLVEYEDIVSENSANDQRETLRDRRNVLKQKLLRMLIDAGWKLQYRPRNGRNYNDTIYVNPDGRAFWSITLAYRVLKKHYDCGGANSFGCKAGFKFTPLPEEELNLLTKVISKIRCDKNKKRHKSANAFGTGETTILKRESGKRSVKKSSRSTIRSQKKSNKARNYDNPNKQYAPRIHSSKLSAVSDSDGYVLSTGNRSVISWMIDLGAISEKENVQYMREREKSAGFRGLVMKDGILCSCCNRILTLSEFESHAGHKSQNPSANIYLDSGISLLQCQQDTWNRQDEDSCKGFHIVDISGDDPNDDTCGICGEGGELFCCDGCPATFHQSCLNIENIPSGVWYCFYCKCKACHSAKDVHSTEEFLLCCICQEKYHESCVKDNYIDGNCSLFCGKDCCELYEGLHNLLGVKHELQDGFSWSLVRRCDMDSDVIVSDVFKKIECNSKVAVALQIMDECFKPMTDFRSGVNLIRNIVYNFGSNLIRLDYRGFLTAVLEKGDEIVAAASIRIHGKELAEMPFIGTRYIYRRQGMCTRLLTAIETGLSSLKVEKLVIPAVSGLMDTWTSVFGFQLVGKFDRQHMGKINMVVFPGVDMLQKPLSALHPSPEASDKMEASAEHGSSN